MILLHYIQCPKAKLVAFLFGHLLFKWDASHTNLVDLEIFHLSTELKTGPGHLFWMYGSGVTWLHRKTTFIQKQRIQSSLSNQILKSSSKPVHHNFELFNIWIQLLCSSLLEVSKTTPEYYFLMNIMLSNWNIC